MTFRRRSPQGRNLAGQVGLFPGSYTASAPPPAPTASNPTTIEPETHHTKTLLQPLTEESESESPSIVSPVPKQAPSLSFLSNGDDDYEPGGKHFRDDSSSLHLASDPNGEAIQATMTDVQKAIEQLGGAEDGDGSRSFSFSSTRDGADTDDTDFDLSDLDNGPAEAADGGEDWHKVARAKLAARAKRAVQEAEKLEAMMLGDTAARRAIPLPIEAELSDESDGEEGEYTRTKFLVHNQQTRNQHGTIVEEDEDLESLGHGKLNGNGGLGHSEDLKQTETPGASSKATAIVEHRSSGGTDLIIPPKIDSDDQTATATKASFTVFSPPPSTAHTVVRQPSPPVVPPAAPSPMPAPPEVSVPPPATTSDAPLDDLKPPRATSPARAAYPTPVTPAVPVVPDSSTPSSGSRRNSAQPNGLHSPSPSTHFHVKHPSTSSTPSALVPTPSTAPVTASTPHFVPPLVKDDQPSSAKKAAPPSEWSVEDVVEWLKSKKFDQDVCDKFIGEQLC